MTCSIIQCLRRHLFETDGLIFFSRKEVNHNPNQPVVFLRGGGGGSKAQQVQKCRNKNSDIHIWNKFIEKLINGKCSFSTRNYDDYDVYNMNDFVILWCQKQMKYLIDSHKQMKSMRIKKSEWKCKSSSTLTLVWLSIRSDLPDFCEISSTFVKKKEISWIICLPFFCAFSKAFHQITMILWIIFAANKIEILLMIHWCLKSLNFFFFFFSRISLSTNSKRRNPFTKQISPEIGQCSCVHSIHFNWNSESAIFVRINSINKWSKQLFAVITIHTQTHSAPAEIAATATKKRAQLSNIDSWLTVGDCTGIVLAFIVCFNLLISVHN